MGIFNKIKKTKKTKEKKQNNNNLNYKLAGLYLNDSVDLTPIENKIDKNSNNITENNNKIVENTNKINEQTNKINEHTLKINEHTTTLNDQNTRINNNINNIATNVNNINNINTKINKITNDLNNANLANYKGLYNNTINYKLGDLVSDNNTNNVYLSVSNNNINNPLNNNNFWKIITFTVDTSNFLTDSSLTPIRNNINNNSSEITNIKNRLDNINPNKAVGGSEFRYLDGTWTSVGLPGGGYLYNITIPENGIRSLIGSSNIVVYNDKIYCMTIFIKEIFTNYTTPQVRNHTITLIYNANAFTLRNPSCGFETIAYQKYATNNPCRMSGYVYVREI